MWSSKTFLNSTTGRPSPANATPNRQHSQLLSLAMRAEENVTPASSDQANASAAPAQDLPSLRAAKASRLSIHDANNLPWRSTSIASKRWLAVSGVIGCGEAKLAPPSVERLKN